VARIFILTSLILELYEKLEEFPYSLDMLECLEENFGKQNLISKKDTDTEMTDVISIDEEVVKLKELG
jgi:hypothetical protein